jgi:hypothetical protein
VKILPEIGDKIPEKFKTISGICHHMLLQKHMILDLFSRVEKQDGTGDLFYKIFLKNAENFYSVAEYNLYFYFLASIHPNDYEIRILRYKNTADFNLWKYRWRLKYDYCSFHSYLRENKKNRLQKITQNLSKRFGYADDVNHKSALRNLILTDGKKKLFIFFKPLISLARNLTRISK